MFAERIFLMIPVLLAPLFLHAQGFVPEADAVSGRLAAQVGAFPQEKVYLSTDKGYYMAGDTIRLRAHVTDAASGRPLAVSGYVYVELHGGTVTEERITALGNNARTGDAEPVRIKLLDRDGVYEGYIPLPVTMGEGDYTLCAYTLFMKNMGPDCYFKRGVRVTAYGKPYLRPETRRRDLRGYDVSFFPEGGYLVGGSACNLAFKALRPDGLSERVRGTIVDEKGDTAAFFETLHAGMGTVRFVPEPGTAYYAECIGGDGSRKRFALPQCRDDAAVLAVAPGKECLNVSVLRGSAVPPSAPLYLLAQSGGRMLYFSPWNPEAAFVRFDTESLPAGVIQLLLLDAEGNALSERLCFNMKPGELVSRLRAVPDKEHYSRRDNLAVELELADAGGRPLEGVFSVAVTDDRLVDTRTPQNILTYMLLESELRGFIEDPAYYFDSGHPDAARALDALMLTQGWRRYDIPAVLKGRIAEPSEPLEVGQAVSGTVYRFRGFGRRPYGDCEVQLISPKRNFVNIASPDAEGRFVLGGFDFPDGTGYVLRAVRGDGSGNRLELEVDPEPGPADIRPVPAVGTDTGLDLYNANVGEFTDTMYHIFLEDIVVTARREAMAESPYEFYADQTLTYEDIEREHYTNLEDILMRMPRISIVGDRVLYMGYPCSFIINGIIQRDVQQPGTSVLYGYKNAFMSGGINIVSVDDIAQINFIRPSMAAMFGSELAGGGAISIVTKSGAETMAAPRIEEFPDIKRVRPLGYQEPVEFYMPKYDTPRQRNAPERDLRTTLYWNPAMRFGSGGTAEMRFTTADSPSDYTVLIEGVTPQGKVVRATASITCGPAL